MGTITRQLSRVSIVPQGTWNSSNTYLKLDLVNYQGKSYIAKQDVPVNIDIENTNYWMLIVDKGDKGNKGTSITSITKTNTSRDGLTDTYTITFSDTLQPQTFTIRHGAGVVSTVDGILAIDQEVTLLITGNGAPTINTAAPILTRYLNLSDNTLYICIAHNTNGSTTTYTWVQASIAASIIGTDYNSTSTYAVGDCILKNESNNSQQLYRCTTAITTPEVWNSSHWEATTINSELKKKYEKPTTGIPETDFDSIVKASLNRADAIVRPNLLSNWYFIGGGSQQGGEQFPINQRGKERYSSALKYTIDRWKLNTYPQALELSSNGITIIKESTSSAGFITQILDYPYESLAGKTVTYSILYDPTPFNNNKYKGLATGTGVVPATMSTGPDITIIIDLKDQMPNPSSHNRFQFDPTTNELSVRVAHVTSSKDLITSTTIIAVKLEIGDTQTLVHNEGTENEPVWVLNELPNYQEQLIRCKTSTADSTDKYANQTIVYMPEIETKIDEECPDAYAEVYTPQWQVTRIKEGSFIASTRLYLSQIPIENVTTSGIGYTAKQYIRFPFPSIDGAGVSGTIHTYTGSNDDPSKIDGAYLGMVQSGKTGLNENVSVKYPIGITYRLFNPNRSKGEKFNAYCRFIITGLIAKPLERPEFTNEDSDAREAIKKATEIAQSYVSPKKNGVDYRFTYGPCFVYNSNPVLTGDSAVAKARRDQDTNELLYGGRLVCDAFIILILAGVSFENSPFMALSNTYGEFGYKQFLDDYKNPENYNWCNYLFTDGRMTKNLYRGSNGYTNYVWSIAMLMWQLWTDNSDTTPVTIFSNKNYVQEGDIGFIQVNDMTSETGSDPRAFDNLRHIVYIGADDGELYVYEVTWETTAHPTAVYKTKFSEYNRDITYFVRLRYGKLNNGIS